MKKVQKIKRATRKTRIKNFKNMSKKVIVSIWHAIKWVWQLLCRVCRAIWNWLKSIDIVGMVNLTLLVAIIVLFASLINDFVRCNKCQKTQGGQPESVVATKNVDNRKVVQRKFKQPPLPIKARSKTGLTPKIKTAGVAKPQIVREVSLPVNKLPQQVLSGDIVIDYIPATPILLNGVKVNGNLFIQNMRKFTLPCDAKINGNIFVRNVGTLNFCGTFHVKGNIYVNRESSLGRVPGNARIDGNVIF